jgi:hypothetical protein
MHINIKWLIAFMREVEIRMQNSDDRENSSIVAPLHCNILQFNDLITSYMYTYLTTRLLITSSYCGGMKSKDDFVGNTGWLMTTCTHVMRMI